MVRRAAAATFVSLSLAPAMLLAQAPSANPSTDAVKAQYRLVKAVLARTAAKVPEDLYAFKPTPEVRSLGEILGHVADSQFAICSVAAGEKPPQSDIEKTKKTKADLSKALSDSTAYCDQVLGQLDDTKGMAVVKFLDGPTPKLNVLTFNIAHDYEHYGNLVTYMRLKGIVPPSSEPQGRGGRGGE